MSARKTLAILTAAAALIAGPVLSAHASTTPTATYAEQARAAGLSEQQAGELQRQVDAVLARSPQARQTSANTVDIPGGTATVALPGSAEARAQADPEAYPSCADGHLCILDGRNVRYDYYRCGYYDFDGIGDGTFNNNQTSGTRARFYNQNGSERWSSVAKAVGTANWTPVYHIRPC
ncbi:MULTISPECIES: hypothetical protein [unclassified Streptomyces]|uniref:hypothetical protein n=1 Tax=unclassified Streptomyces TaxID=2593676 RepID=UPI001661257C|nr:MULTISPECIES: hypothetical protein [unclassified Streptomyces]MBD0710881.1 hypothetical protein [Streptomyces sp. CBMA291]MBD0717846.1 hypothetical protein [Streptomyces sp. CBMA370]